MITLKTAAEIAKMRISNQIVRDTLNLLEEKIRPGMTTEELNQIAHRYILKQNATPSFLGYNGFPASICTSVNDEVVHGIPGARVLQEGDIVSVDIGAVKDGWHGDAARTFAVGQISKERQRLIEVTKQSFYEAVEILKEGIRLGDVGRSIQAYVEKNGYSVVRALVGHGIGTKMHESPEVPNYGTAGTGLRIKKGMTLAIEPMVNAGTFDVRQKSDGWTIVTADGSDSAHYENTVAVSEDGAEILSI